MCDPKPGARCSADTRKELARAQAAHASASREVDRHPDDPSARRRLDQAGRNLGEKWAAYDSSPQGQKDLLSAIGEAPNPSSPDVDELRTRLFIGRRTRVEQKQALARARGLSVEEGTLQGDKVLSRLRHPDGGFTRHPDTGREESLGFFVSPYPDREKVVPVADLRPIDIIRYTNANRDLWDRPGHYMGAWHDPDTGLVSLDVSVKTPSAEEARTIAGDHAQVAFYDAQTGSSVEVSHTARDRIASLIERNES